jgi:hypothetical protein
MEDSADELILTEIQDNARVAGQRLRASYNLMCSKGMLNNPNYRELEQRRTIALAMAEGGYSEALAGVVINKLWAFFSGNVRLDDAEMRHGERAAPDGRHGYEQRVDQPHSA